jgi:ectoine hydroxylase-related dioxygenase (phytanoyl-CoA dioxygenase family)
MPGETPARHPFNHGFDWKPIEGPFRRLSHAQADSYNAEGWFVLREAIPKDVLERVIAEIDPFEEKTEAFLASQKDGRLFIARAGEITFTTHLVTRSTYLKDFVRSELFQDVAADVLGPDVRLYWDQAVYKKPGAEDIFPWHQDNGYTFIEPQQYLTCWVALTDADERNGCPWIVPGLHRRGTLRHRPSDLGHVCLEGRPPGAVPVPARAGDVVVFSSLTPHATGPNRSDAVRKAYIVQFAPAGAEGVAADGTRSRVADPQRQFPVLVAGETPE